VGTSGFSGYSGYSGSGGGGGGLTWNEVTGTTQSLAADNGYIMNNASLVTGTLPATCALGKTIALCGKGTGLYKIAQNSGQTIHFGNQDTTTGTGGYLQATHRRDAIALLCTVADTEFTILNSVGNFTVA
jgi:hypothetical protein